MPDQPNNTLYINALLDGLPVDPPGGKADLSQAYQACGYDATGSIRPLRSIVGQLGDEDKGRYFDPAPLALGLSAEKQGVFAEATNAPGLDDWEAKVRADFSDFQAKTGNSQHYSYSLYHFLHAYGSRVAYGKHEDASLFDRNRVLAAVASCLTKTKGLTDFLILKGAISGIQQYIYHEIKAEQMGDAKKTAKRLRGRSFLVSFINQVIAEHLVETLGLEQANVLFVGGGNFVLLLPKTSGMEGQLKAELKNINLGLLKNIGPQLGLLADWVSAGADIGQRFPEHYAKLQPKLEAQKQRRYRGYLAEVFDFFDNQSEKEVWQQRKQAIDEEARIGTLAPYAHYILEVKGDTGVLNDLSLAVQQKVTIKGLSFLGKHFYIIKGDREDDATSRSSLAQFLSNHAEQLQACEQLKIIALNHPGIMSAGVEAFSKSGLDIAYGFQFVGSYAPQYQDPRQFKGVEANDNSVMLFEHLAMLTNGQAQAPDLTHQQLGVLRLDVDDLGAIFSNGLGAAHNMQRLLCLSREFQLFFGGYFNELARKHHIYVTYSGGDDAFVIGSWWNALCFARELEKDFRRFTCGNEQVNFSAGLFVCNPHYPIPRLAKDAEAAEHKAKKHQGGSKGKNALHVFNHTLSWEDFQKMMAFSDDMQQVVGKGEEGAGKSFKRSMVRRFLRIINVHNDKRFQSDKAGDLRFERMRHIAALHGLLARHGYGSSSIEGSASLDKTGKLIQELVQAANTDSEAVQQTFDHYTVPLHIALYLSKTN